MVKTRHLGLQFRVSKINVEGSEISIIAIDNRDYISLTDMVRDIENGSALIEKWLRNKNTIEFLGIWKKCIIRILIPPNSMELKMKQDLTVLYYQLSNGWKKLILSVSLREQEDMVERMLIKI